MMRVIGISILTMCLLGCAPANGGRANENRESDAPESEEVKQQLESDADIGDGNDRPMLEMMSYEEFSGAIEMGMGCSFVAQNNVDPIFVATAEDSAEISGRAAIKIDGRLIVLEQKGYGIAQVEEGGLFFNEAIEVTIDRPKMEPTSNSESTYYWNATLNVSQDEGGSNSYEGKYECGA